MDQQQQELRHSAAKAFIESLDQLHEALQTADCESTPSQNGSVGQPETHSSLQFDLDSFEQAIADIEQFIETKSNSS